MSGLGIGIQGLGHELPPRRVTSADLADGFRDLSGDAVLTGRALSRLTGVNERRYADEGTCSSDLAASAALKALAQAGLVPGSIDLLIFAAASHDLAEPATANRVQKLTGCARARVLDVKNACNSFLDAIDVASALIAREPDLRVLVATGEVISPFVQMTETAAHGVPSLIAGLTLGDAGAAAVLGRHTPQSLAQVLPGSFRSLGEHWNASRIAAGGSRHGRDFSEAYFVSDSPLLFTLATEHVGDMIARALDGLGWTVDDVDLVIPHQASANVTRAICKATGISFDRCVITGHEFGNTAAASIPLALSVAAETGRLQAAERVLLVGGAAGFSAAVVPLLVGAD